VTDLPDDPWLKLDTDKRDAIVRELVDAGEDPSAVGHVARTIATNYSVHIAKSAIDQARRDMTAELNRTISLRPEAAGLDTSKFMQRYDALWGASIGLSR
jgi:hypothetical protein